MTLNKAGCALIVALFVAYTLAQNPQALVHKAFAQDACADCKANISKMADFLVLDQVLNATVTSFQNDLCTNNAYTNDTKGCVKNATIWIPMAKAFFPQAEVQMIACQEMGKCNKTEKIEINKLVVLTVRVKV